MNQHRHLIALHGATIILLLILISSQHIYLPHYKLRLTSWTTSRQSPLTPLHLPLMKQNYVDIVPWNRTISLIFTTHSQGIFLKFHSSVWRQYMIGSKRQNDAVLALLPSRYYFDPSSYLYVGIILSVTKFQLLSVSNLIELSTPNISRTQHVQSHSPLVEHSYHVITTVYIYPRS